MAIVIRYRCQRCGALWEGIPGTSAWVRCGSCRALVDFDWQALFESDAYRAALQRASARLDDWSAYHELHQKALACARGGDRRGALEHFRAATAQQLQLTPYVYPAEAHQPGPYREGVLAFSAWWLLQLASDPELAALQQALVEGQRGLDHRDPLPTLDRAVDLLRKQSARLGASDAPPDPDGMEPAGRFRVWAGMFLGAFLPLLSPSQRLAMVKRLHGEANVSVQGDLEADSIGLYFDWTCPACALTSLQARTGVRVTCFGCAFSRPVRPSDMPLPAVRTRCPGCGAEVEVEEGALQVTCRYCRAISTQLGRTGAVEREFALAVQAEWGAGAIPDAGVPGMEVTPQNRTELALNGLTRLVRFMGPLVSAERLGQAARSTFAALGLSEPEGLAQVRARLLAEAAAEALPNAEALARYLLAHPPPKR